ncbi:MAG: class I SAM-dependent methyltransferase [Bacillota bacterium]
MNSQESADPSRYFAGAADDYDDWYRTARGAFIDEIETELAFRLLTPRSGWRVLDAGCGTGNFSFKLAERGCTVTGVDVSADMLQRALARAAGGDLPVRFCQMDIGDLEFPDATFDAIYSMAAFEFIRDRPAAFRELWRVLKPGGRLMIGTIADDSPWGASYRRAAETDPSSVFAFADFATRDEMESIEPDHLAGSGECLFIPPDAPEEAFTRKREGELAGSCRGGFFCVTWERPPERLACQLSLYPLSGTASTGETVDGVVDEILAYHPDAEVNAMSTILTSDPEGIGRLLAGISRSLISRDLPFSLVCTLSNRCGLPRGDCREE